MKVFQLSVFIFIISCQPQKLEVQQIISDEPISIFPYYEDTHPDSINMKIPTEYLFNVKPKDIGFPPVIYYIKDDDLKSRITTYNIYNKKSKRLLYKSLDENIPINLLFIDHTFHLSKIEAQSILDRYKINKNVNEIKIGDSVNVAPYKIVRKDFPWIVDRLNKIPDSVAFNFTKDHFLGKKVKIKW